MTVSDAAPLLRVESPVASPFPGVRIAAVIPACDEEPRVGRVVATIPPWVERIVLVDDGSRDGTRARARAVGDRRLCVVGHPSRSGVGRAIATGYRRAFADGADVVAVLAGDAQMDPRDLEAVVAPVARGRAGYAKGNRLAHPDVARAMPASRRLGGVALSLLTRAVSGLEVWDSQCGYTAISAYAWSALGRSVWSGYGYPNDVLVRLARARVVVEDVVVRPVYNDKRGGMGARHALGVVPFVLARAALRARADARG
jgi:glycosyltransferase involved in cell wall biosynthesis